MEQDPQDVHTAELAGITEGIPVEPSPSEKPRRTSTEDDRLVAALFKSAAQHLALIALVGSDEAERITLERFRHSSDLRGRTS